VLAGRAAWDDVPTALREEGDFLRRFVAEQGVQTNEVQRSWVLAPLFLRVAQRTGCQVLDLVELGPSGGLNLLWDRYAYRYRHGRWGPSEPWLELRGEERSPVPAALLDQHPVVDRRAGIDRAPIDVTSDEGARLLACFVWPDQHDRLELLRRAIETVRRDPPELLAGDIVERLPAVLGARRPGTLTIVFQTAVLGYLDADGRRRVREILEEAGAEGPLAFVSAGNPRTGESRWGLRVVTWPGGEREFLGHADYHGAWLDWGSP
jgi:hypothetical protein